MSKGNNKKSKTEKSKSVPAATPYKAAQSGIKAVIIPLARGAFRVVKSKSGTALTAGVLAKMKDGGMQNFSTRHVEMSESLRLGIKPGWYGTKISGTFVTGPHSTQESCLGQVIALQAAPATTFSNCEESRSVSTSV